ncbi:glycoside hydrolase family 9 protein [Hymenobacter sp. YC55]|uniref:glycoside hydrolase family 9 protein n=1 Tax=Hymenobacter sp. YC55 TaxID=3034019 RepID=UPI0023F8D949|nr:glycoside hydrolase family 9 protein [Hymenobacter sp. YC55]
MSAQQLTESIKLNQIGFYPAAPKVAMIVGAPAGKFSITTPDRTTTVFTGELGAQRHNEFSNQDVRTADFSSFTTPGTYVLAVPTLGYSYTFQIQPRVHAPLAAAALKSYYYQRASTALPVTYAGVWNRPMGHPDNQVLVHASAASKERPAGTVISSSRGWYDAGDYNKYIVNSGITLSTLLSLYEDFPAYGAQLKAQIPESSNAIPDILDESLWNLRWMLSMQDPHDGGVYHKLTNAKFDGMVMPTECQTPRYVVQKSTAAALDFAAVLAQSSRVFRQFERQLPGLADSCLRASTRAWEWASAHPAVYYEQDALNKQFQPAIATGTYGDRDVQDEWSWAATELYATTKQDKYYQAIKLLPEGQLPLPSWNQVRALGYYTLVRLGAKLPAKAEKDVVKAKKEIQTLADALAAGTDTRAYQTVMGKTARDFSWGSNSNAGNQGIALIQAYQISGNPKYLHYALTNLDYMLGRNALGISFVTGYGAKTPQHPHHRLSEGDKVQAPLPGFLVGGPNPGQQDKCQYPFTTADMAYADDVCSYASNEIAINWNAPLVYLAGAMEALQGKL